MDRNPETEAKTIHNLTFVELTDRKKRTLFRGKDIQMPLEKVRIYEGKVVGEGKSKDLKDYVFRINYSTKQSRDLPYTYWMNDRIAYVKSIEVDLSALGEQYWKKAKLHRFFSSSQWVAELSLESGRAHIPLDTWSVSGDGIVLLWCETTNLETKEAPRCV